MPTALFVGLPLHGHTNPTLPLVRALAESGHAVDSLSTPLVVIPHTGEQEIVASRIAELGAGIRLHRAGLTALRLTDAIRQVAGDVWVLTSDRADSRVVPVRRRGEPGRRRDSGLHSAVSIP